MQDTKRKKDFEYEPKNKGTGERGKRLKEEGIAAYIGISSPETPKYLLTNNFLLEYFSAPNNAMTQYNFEFFQERGVLDTEDEANKERLKHAFDCFVRRYLGEDTIREENRRLSENKHYYFPVIQEMLTGSNPTLRHMLFHLQALDEGFDFRDMREKLERYIFHDESGISRMLKILLQSEEGNIEYKERPLKEVTENFWSLLPVSELNRMKRLGRILNRDLNTMLTHEYFCRLDFYRKYNYLSLLLTSYVIQYIVYRRDANMGMLCKGASSDSRLNGAIHRACCNNYVEIRNLFPNLLQQYYAEMVQSVANEEGYIYCRAEGDKVYIGDKSFEDFSSEVMGSRSRKPDLSYDTIIQAFGLNEWEEAPISVEDFVIRYINLKKARGGSVLTKITSILPTSGRQIDMIFPKSNAKQKYFAMSPSLTEFYVRLYLAEKRQQYDYLDNFIEHLEARYRIVLTKTKNTDKLLKSTKPRLTAQDFMNNKAAFIDTLNSVNCLVKLSDSGYVVTLPEEKGGLKLI